MDTLILCNEEPEHEIERLRRENRELKARNSFLASKLGDKRYLRGSAHKESKQVQQRKSHQ